MGGHADFCVGASRSVGGLSIIALRSVAGNGRPTIVPAVDVVSTSRSDIQVVVTEHGIADLRNVGDDERARRLIAIAAPEHRADLGAAIGIAALTWIGSRSVEARCQPLHEVDHVVGAGDEHVHVAAAGVHDLLVRSELVVGEAECLDTVQRAAGPAGANASARCVSVAVRWLMSG